MVWYCTVFNFFCQHPKHSKSKSESEPGGVTPSLFSVRRSESYVTMVPYSYDMVVMKSMSGQSTRLNTLLLPILH